LFLALVDSFNVSNKASKEFIITVNSGAGAFDVDNGLGGDDGDGDDDGDGGGINGDDAAWSRRRRSYVLTIVMVPEHIIKLYKNFEADNRILTHNFLLQLHIYKRV
jgi:hypothetical protein